MFMVLVSINAIFATATPANIQRTNYKTPLLPCLCSRSVLTDIYKGSKQAAVAADNSNTIHS